MGTKQNKYKIKGKGGSEGGLAEKLFVCHEEGKPTGKRCTDGVMGLKALMLLRPDLTEEHKGQGELYQIKRLFGTA